MERMELGAKELLDLFSEIEKISKESITVYLIGGGAMAIRGLKESTKDVDLILPNQDDAMLFSSAYTTVVGILSPLITPDTIVISDELNHNCIINALKLSRPKDKKIYKHLDMKELEKRIKESINKTKRLIIVTDGIFSMRGDYAPLDIILELSDKYDQ